MRPLRFIATFAIAFSFGFSVYAASSCGDALRSVGAGNTKPGVNPKALKPYQVLALEGRYAEARVILWAGKEDAILGGNLGESLAFSQALNRTGERGLAVEVAINIVRLNPESALAKFNLDAMLLSEGLSRRIPDLANLKNLPIEPNIESILSHVVFAKILREHGLEYERQNRFEKVRKQAASGSDMPYRSALALVYSSYRDTAQHRSIQEWILRAQGVADLAAISQEASAELAMARRRSNDALEYSRVYASHHPGSPVALLLLARSQAYGTGKGSDLAIETIRSIKDADNRPDVNLAWARVLITRGQRADAEARLKAVEQSGLYRDEVDTERARIAFYNGDLAAARKLAKDIVDNPMREVKADAFSILVQIAIRQNDVLAASELLTSYPADLSLAELHRLKATVAYISANYKTAVANYEYLKSVEVLSLESMTRYAISLHHSGSPEAANRIFAFRLRSANPGLVAAYARYLKETGQPNLALPQARAAYEADPKNIQIKKLYYALLSMHGFRAQAKALLDGDPRLAAYVNAAQLRHAARRQDLQDMDLDFDAEPYESGR